MDGTDSSESASDKDEDEAPPPQVSDSLSGVRLTDAPILLLVYFHKALRAELFDLRRTAAAALERGSYNHELILKLHRRFEFLKLVYKCHCETEDEVIFLALDVNVHNVACTYSLEHKSIDDVFESVFDRLNVLLEGDQVMSKPFQELVFCIGTLQTFIGQHMLKEEEQVFPLLMQQFSCAEQASLVFQFLCSVPVMLLEVILPWLMSFFSEDEKRDITHCIREIVPEETSMQEVVFSWFVKDTGPRAEHIDGFLNQKGILKFLSAKRSFGENWSWNKACGLQTNAGYGPIDGLLLWHRTIRKDLEGILDNLYQIKSSNVFLDLDSTIVQLKFLIDVIILYRTTMEKFCYPVLNELPSGCPSPPEEQFHIEGLQKLLNHFFQDGIPLCKFVETLICELESFVMQVSKQFSFQETEVFTIFSQNCSNEMQQQLLYMTLYMMPLGLLKSVITWFSAHLSENESKYILHGINQEDSLVDKSFASLLHDWFRIGYSGKTSVENFRMNLQKMFKSRCSFPSEQIKESVESSSFLPLEPIFTTNDNKCLSYSSSSDSHTTMKNETLYSSGINLHVFFPPTIRTLYPAPKVSVETGCTTSSTIDAPIPIDLIFLSHKALKNDLEYLVSGSAELVKNAPILMEFHRRFHLIRFLYQIHSDAEDEVAFPALEAKGKLQNITHSYSIDHRLESENFIKISHILNEMVELQVSVSSINSNTQNQAMFKYHRLCIRLHDICKSMHKLLSEHVHREETELWPLFRECFSIEEQENIIRAMLGRIRAETLQDMIPWLMASLTPEEQGTMMSLWLNATKYTLFEEWLGEWWEGYVVEKVTKKSKVAPKLTAYPLEIISTYLSNDVQDEQKGESVCKRGSNFPQKNCSWTNIESLEKCNEEQNNDECSECKRHCSHDDEKKCNEVTDIKDWIDKPGQIVTDSQKCRKHGSLCTMSQENMVAAIRRVSRDSSLDPQRKSYIIQNLLMSDWITGQKITQSEITASSNGEEIPGQNPSYQDPLKLLFGCKHYTRNCKLVAPCCNQLYTCIRCHDEVAEHQIDRKSVTKMMCMKCLIIQPIGSTCSTISCKNFSMGRYYCRICKLFDDDREIYHCPYCNLCRLGKGLGIDYFHCMKCNACMARSLSVHVCREKSFMDNCPICHEDIFTSNDPVKALPCGHSMHSACFRDYTCTHYTCPICSKSLGDMQVYFRMLDALLAEEKIPQEYSGRTQVILCNDCEKRGNAPFHWLYHKCSNCGSYNTRLL
ncbi:hypothetical protein Dsin_005913 [Dipteronia sinensis]|uniref:Zinc finger protein n=1 Tax=Dipteronia sinensis TaxID=43782 RepID=A0AAE0AXH2_9ROSI|nr:hypothetical protein Dsin_005913 [Dipteronia sinensis]